MTGIEVLRPGPATTVQDWPGRLGYWQIGVPPSGPMDDVSFRLANIAVGNPEGAPGLETTLARPYGSPKSGGSVSPARRSPSPSTESLCRSGNRS